MLANAKKHRQKWFSRLQNLSQTTQNRARSDPKPEKNDQHEPKEYKKRSRTSQERKKDAQERKMCQHGPNIKDFGLRWACHNAARTPPRKEKPMLMQANNAVGSNTPGAASSAADFKGFGPRFGRVFGRFLRYFFVALCSHKRTLLKCSSYNKTTVFARF